MQTQLAQPEASSQSCLPPVPQPSAAPVLSLPVPQSSATPVMGLPVPTIIASPDPSAPPAPPTPTITTPTVFYTVPRPPVTSVTILTITKSPTFSCSCGYTGEPIVIKEPANEPKNKECCLTNCCLPGIGLLLKLQNRDVVIACPRCKRHYP